MDPITFQAIMMAAGMGLQIFGTFGSGTDRRLASTGEKLDQSILDYQLEALKTKFAVESLDSMIDLRKTLGAQIARDAAMGRGGASAYAIGQASVAAQARDEKFAQFNLTGQELSLKSQKLQKDIANMQGKQQKETKLIGELFSKFPASSIGDWAFNQNIIADLGDKVSPGTFFGGI
jgi:hypothetical protein